MILLQILILFKRYANTWLFLLTAKKGQDFWQPSAIIRPDGVDYSSTYDIQKNTLRHKDGENREVVFHYGPFELLRSIEDAKGGKLAFTYDSEERLKTVTNQLGQVWSFERDAAGRVIKETDFAALTQKYEYDKADRITKATHSDGTYLTYSYDKSGLIVKEHAHTSDGALQDETTYAYDNNGLLNHAENNSASVHLVYDKLNRIAQERLNGRRIDNLYDCCGRRIGQLINDKNFIKTLYDPLGALQSLTIGKHSPLQMTLDPLGREPGSGLIS